MPGELDSAVFQWEEADRRLDAILRDDPARARSAWSAVARVQDELRRRIGSTFTAAELADLYEEGTDWALELAGPGSDSRTIADVAFLDYVRRASDWWGGRVLTG